MQGYLSRRFINVIARASAFFARLIGPGGGGGGAPAGGPSDSAVGSGGGAGGYAEKFEISNVIRLDLLILAPQGGAGAIAGASPGSSASSGAAILFNVGGLNHQTLVAAIPAAAANDITQARSYSLRPEV